MLCLYWCGLLHLARGFRLGLQGCEWLGIRRCYWGWTREATGYVGWGGRGPTRRGRGRGLRWHLGLSGSMVLLQLLLLLRLQAGRGIGWRGGVCELGCRTTGQLGAMGAQSIHREVRVLRLLERRDALNRFHCNMNWSERSNLCFRTN